MMTPEKVGKTLLCHSGLRAGSMPGDPESSHFNMFWIPAFAGMTIIELFTRASNKNYV